MEKELALKYLDIFYNNKPLDELYSIFVDDLIFEGPFIKTYSAHEYINSLKNAPPKDSSYRLINLFEKDEYINVIYEFTKGNISTLMSQLFEMKNEKIISIKLIFDSSVFT